MPLHIADPELTRLVADLAKLEGTTKTEALRQLLRKTLNERRKQAKRAGFRELALKIGDEARRRSIKPIAKEEMDDLWGMNDLRSALDHF